MNLKVQWENMKKEENVSYRKLSASRTSISDDIKKEELDEIAIVKEKCYEELVEFVTTRNIFSRRAYIFFI